MPSPISGRMEPRRTVGPPRTSPPTPRKAGAASSRAAKLKGKASHQDMRSFIIATIAVGSSIALVGVVWLFLRQPPSPAPLVSMEGVTEVVGGADKRDNVYWRESYGKFRHYYTDPATGRMVDGGTVGVEDMLKQGIEVPGYRLTGSDQDDSTSNNAALAERFKAIRDHLN